jgi:hypothetical protein
MKEQVLDILKEGINDIEALKKQYPKMYTQDVIDALRRLQDRINELTIPDVSQQRELLMATLTSRVLTIQSEPNGIVRETMINNLLIDINCG